MLKVLFFFSCIVWQFPAVAQTTGTPMGLWLGYNLRKPVGKNFSWNTDLQVRFRNQSAAYDYTLVRTALQYLKSEHLSFTAGALYGTDNYEPKKAPVWKDEKRLFEEARYLTGKLEKLQLQLQFRLEQRWFSNENADGTEGQSYITRSRYRVDVRRNINKKWRLNIGEEYMVNLSHFKSSFNQNRAWAGISRIVGSNEIQAQLMRISWKAPDATILRINFLHQLHS